MPAFPSLEEVTDPVEDDSLVGRWKEIDTVFGSAAEKYATGRQVEISRTGAGYALTFVDGLGSRSSPEEFVLFEIAGRQYVQASLGPAPNGAVADRFAIQLLERGRDALRLRPLNNLWVEQRFARRDDGWTARIEATPEEVRAALEEPPENAFCMEGSSYWLREQKNQEPKQAASVEGSSRDD
ncbi:MAG: hypothetical protein RIC11_12540 [Botrimarina sp.]